MALSTGQRKVLKMVLSQHAYTEDWCLRNWVNERTFRVLARKGAVRFDRDTGQWHVTAEARREAAAP